jgi:hypothetical protein
MMDYRIIHGNSYFLELRKWGKDLTPEEAKKLGLIKELKDSTPSSPADQKVTKVTRRKKVITNNNK